MKTASAESASRDQWTLIRNARQVLTLHGPSGPRRGLAMSALNVISNGALLIHNGLIENVGPARRIENLAEARDAREIDASGRIVMPAFVDPDMALVMAPQAGDSGANSIRLMSRKRVLARATPVASEWARYGSLTVGAHTGAGVDLKTVSKVLRTHQALQSKPLRIRSIVSPLAGVQEANGRMATEALVSRWLPAIRKKNLAAVLELTPGAPEGAFSLEHTRELAVAAAALGFVIRIRSAGPLDPAAVELASAAGAISVIAPCEPPAVAACLATLGCAFVLALPPSGDSPAFARRIRAAIDEGAAIALASTCQPDALVAFNMQYVIHLAVRGFGFTPEEAITATTYNAASSLRLSHVTGSLEPGKSADLLVMDVPDYRELARRPGHSDIHLAMRGGQTVSGTTH